MDEAELETTIRVTLLLWEDETAQGLVREGRTEHVQQGFPSEGPMLYLYRREALVMALLGAIRGR